eukprot:m.79270 g.79270  ORF g.79270 m.79270 type:complete len:57 (+) comp12706_c0_seq1:1360-1530(+)
MITKILFMQAADKKTYNIFGIHLLKLWYSKSKLIQSRTIQKQLHQDVFSLVRDKST